MLDFGLQSEWIADVNLHTLNPTYEYSIA